LKKRPLKPPRCVGCKTPVAAHHRAKRCWPCEVKRRRNPRNNANWRHGHASGGKLSGLYVSWYALKTRMFNPNWHGHQHYDGKGLECDPMWLTFEGFAADMKPTWFPKAHLHRRNSSYGYFKDNCVWMERGEHQRLHQRQQKELRSGQTSTALRV